MHVVMISPVLPKGPRTTYLKNHTLGKEEYPNIIRTVGHRV